MKTMSLKELLKSLFGLTDKSRKSSAVIIRRIEFRSVGNILLAQEIK